LAKAKSPHVRPADVHPEVREQLDELIAVDGETLDRRRLREHVDAWTHTHDPDALAQCEPVPGRAQGSATLLKKRQRRFRMA
jgi:hypothetical protein